MARPMTPGHSLLGPKTVVAFLVGLGVGLALVGPMLPEAVGDELAALMAGGGSVIAVGVGALAIVMVLLAVLYQIML